MLGGLCGPGPALEPHTRSRFTALAAQAPRYAGEDKFLKPSRQSAAGMGAHGTVILTGELQNRVSPPQAQALSDIGEPEWGGFGIRQAAEHRVAAAAPVVFAV